MTEYIAVYATIKKTAFGWYVPVGGVIAGIFEAFALTEQDYTSIAAIYALVLIDTVTGIYRAKKNGRPLSSRGFGQLFGKVIAYGIFYLVVHTIRVATSESVGIEYIGSWIENTAIFAILLREAWSILENLAIDLKPYMEALRGFIKLKQELTIPEPEPVYNDEENEILEDGEGEIL